MLRHFQLLACFLSLSRSVRADFSYPDFNTTVGIEFVGHASVSSCIRNAAYDYGTHYETSEESKSIFGDIDERTDLIEISKFDTVTTEDDDAVNVLEAGFGHSKQAVPSKSEQCPLRIRLVPSFPNKNGAVWYKYPLPVLLGFQTSFTFQITGHSKICTEHRDQMFNTKLHRTCSAKGGDGFAFVLHQDPQKSNAIGENGAGMGYSGLMTSLAVEFDSFYNPDEHSSDLVYDHISIHAGGKNEKISRFSKSQLTFPKKYDFSDGKLHSVKVK